MKSLARLIVPSLAFMAWTVCGDETTDVKFRIVSQHTDVAEVWIGVRVGPIRSGTADWSWTSTESEEFTLEIPQTEEEVALIALRGFSAPILVLVTQELRNSGIELDFNPGKRFSGTILSTDGIEVADAVVSVERQDLPSQQIPSQAKSEWTSAADGTFSIEGLVAGKYELHVDLPYIPTETFDIQINDGKDAEEDLVLDNAHFVRGRVLDHDRNPTVGADVGMYAYVSFQDSGFRQTVPSDSSGEFQFGPFVYGQVVSLSATHTEGGSTQSNDVFSGNHDVNLVLSKLVDVVGTVVDAETGTPLDEFTLRAFGNGWTRQYPHKEANGEIFATIDSLAWALVIESPSYTPHFDTDSDLSTLDEYDMGEVHLEAGIQVTGLVYDSTSRQPIEGASIASWGKGFGGELPTGRTTFIVRYMQMKVNATSDAEGKYSIGPLPSGESVLVASAGGYRAEEIFVDGQSAELDIGLAAVDVGTTRINGRIQTTNGDPIAGQINIYHVENNSGMGYRTEEDGTFEHTTRGGTHQIYASTDRGRSETIELRVSEGATEDVVLVVDPFGRLAGTINGLEGAELAYVSVISGNRAVRGTSRIADGEDFLIEGIGTGPFMAKAWTTMNRQLALSFELTKVTEEAYLEFSFSGDSRLYGKILSLVDRNPYLQVRAIAKDKGAISGWSGILDDGSFEIRGLSDGEYWIEIGEERGSGIAIGKTTDKDRYEAAVAGDTELNIDLASP